MHIWANPVVPVVPLTPKLNESLVESKAKLVTVEFESTENTLWFWFTKGVRAKLEVCVTAE